MELILINEKKLKIMLSPDDMKEYEIDCESVDYDKTETRRAFWSILDAAKQKTGFDAASERVYIQLYPSREGGCEMYVTKIGALPSSCKTSQKGMLRVAAERRLAYRFENIGELLEACSRLSSHELDCKSSAFADGAGRCYLYINGIRGFSVPDALSFIAEFSVAEDPERLDAYIGEYCRPICEANAINTLGVLA